MKMVKISYLMLGKKNKVNIKKCFYAKDIASEQFALVVYTISIKLYFQYENWFIAAHRFMT